MELFQNKIYKALNTINLNKERWQDFVKFTKQIHNGSNNKANAKYEEKIKEMKENEEYFLYLLCI